MRVEVDRARCDGFGFCEQAAPEVLRLDDDGELEILVDPVPGADEARVEEAVRACPVAALQVVR